MVNEHQLVSIFCEIDDFCKVRHEVVGVIALPSECRGDKALCSVRGSLPTQVRWVTVWSEAVGTT